ncbi:MAG: TIGR04348 family glycosyltransferase [Rhizobacter sp.]|nr:TIGR04348 family glycosyltransferase [Rhizobacter sp.]
MRRAAQHRAAVEPGRGVVAVRVRREAIEGRERTARPFPHVAPAKGLGCAAGGAFPLGFGGQAPPRPAAPGLGFVQAEVARGFVRVERAPAAVTPLLPSRGGTAQVARPGARLAGAPACTGLRPPARVVVATALHERQELGPAHGLPVDGKRGQHHLAPGQLVVECEAGAGLAAQAPPAVAKLQRRGRRGQGLRTPARVVEGDAQAACHVERGLVVHVFVQQRQAEEIKRLIAAAGPAQQGQRFVELHGQVVARGGGIGQGQLPAAVVRHTARVVERIGLAARRQEPRRVGVGTLTERTLGVACDPERLEPADVPQFPQRRVELGAQRHGQARQRTLVGGEGGQRVGAAGGQRLGDTLGRTPAGVERRAHQACIVHREPLVIVTPALATANNGNWQTARRWAGMLRPAYRVGLAERWSGGDEAMMIALHARRSAASVQAWRAAHPQRPLVLVLTGTDLYRDIAVDPEARRSLDLADALVLLNELGAQQLPAALRAKAHVVLQSCASRATLPHTQRHLRALMVGHLRAEKDPHTYWRAAQRLVSRADIRLDHIGAALDPALAADAMALAARQPQFRWLGALPHVRVRRHIQAAHVLVHSSRMEGGAHVVIEAIRSGTPVLASRIDGNLGLLGSDYEAVFEPGDDAALAALLVRARDDPAMLPRLSAQLALRAHLFAPEAERATLLQLVGALMARRTTGPAS